MAMHRRAMLNDIVRSAQMLTGDQVEAGHTDMACWSGDYDVQQLLDRLQITVASNEPTASAERPAVRLRDWTPES